MLSLYFLHHLVLVEYRVIVPFVQNQSVHFGNCLNCCCSRQALFFYNSLFTNNLVILDCRNRFLLYNYASFPIEYNKHFIANLSFNHQVFACFVVHIFQFFTNGQNQLSFEARKERYLKHQMQHHVLNIVAATACRALHYYLLQVYFFFFLVFK